ncbi:MAG: 3-isopropylmalate dehydrogenase [Deltaproteobacteria bacterium]|nr:3-isopropylmalate dehydrogenase [Deltaproteobacteria bacterium]MCL5792383.1 3-isopropylmalate dehydrogenase [Deltaproteobacteria bacterium]
MKKRIVVFPGDGIGPEVIEQAKKVLTRAAEIGSLKLDIQEFPIGGASIDVYGVPLKDEFLKHAKKAHAVMLGAVGGPKWDNVDPSIRPEKALLALRKELKAYANLRPVKPFVSLLNASTLKPEVIKDVDILVVRELTGGIYFGKPRGIKKDRKGYNTLVYKKDEIVRIAKKAYEFAMLRKKHVTSVDKANILETSMLWRQVVNEVKVDYPDIKLDHLYVDNCAMQLIRNPGQFDVILTDNMFGDILSDEASMLTGSLGMLPSASIGDKGGIYEPIHGSAPDIAGQGIANPIATIASVSMMLKYSFNKPDLADIIDNAVQKTLDSGLRTKDINDGTGRLVSTSEMGEEILNRIG